MKKNKLILKTKIPENGAIETVYHHILAILNRVRWQTKINEKRQRPRKKVNTATDGSHDVLRHTFRLQSPIFQISTENIRRRRRQLFYLIFVYTCLYIYLKFTFNACHRVYYTLPSLFLFIGRMRAQAACLLTSIDCKLKLTAKSNTHTHIRTLSMNNNTLSYSHPRTTSQYVYGTPVAKFLTHFICKNADAKLFNVRDMTKSQLFWAHTKNRDREWNTYK